MYKPPIALVPVLLTAGLVLTPGCDDSPTEPVPDPVVEAAAGTITAADVAAAVGVIAHDSMGGRGTPSPGLAKTAAYLAAELEALGLEPAGTEGYMQPFEFIYPVRDASTILLELTGGVALEHGRDFLFLASEPGRGDARGPLFWGGDASTHVVGSFPLSGRVVLYDHPVSHFDLDAVLGVTEASQDVVTGGGVAVGYVVGPDFTAEDMARAVARTERHSRWIPEFWIREPVADSLLAAAGHDLATLRAEGPQPLPGDTLHARGLLARDTATPANVAAVLPGSDPARRDEYVAVTAHYDHLGIGFVNAAGDSIRNGADDNASGTVAVLEMAEAMAALETPPARSVLFLLVSAEEYGLLGSEHYVTHPTVPMSGMVANINLDMVGRNDPGQVIGVGKAYSTLGSMTDSLATLHETLGLTLISDPVPEQNLFFRSDQLMFACFDVPALFLHTGLHDDYHSVEDELERLDTDKVARVARLGFYLAHAAATMPGAPEWTTAGRIALAELPRCP